MDGKGILKAFATPMLLLVVFVVALFSVNGLTNKFTKKPELSLISSNEIVTDQSSVPITGVVKNTSKLTVNGETVAVSKDGSFSTTVPVSLGSNDIAIVAGNGTKVTQDVKVTREEVAKATTSTNTGVVGSNLTTSGPVENVMGSFGLAAIVMSLAIYYKSKREKPLQKANSLV